MSFRFRKRLKLGKGLWINLSRKGASLSVGGHGVTANISKRGVRDTFSVRGTGMSYQTGNHGCASALIAAFLLPAVLYAAHFLF